MSFLSKLKENIFSKPSNKILIISISSLATFFIIYKSSKTLKNIISYYSRKLIPVPFETKCLNYIVANSKLNDPISVLDAFDSFLKKGNFMMNVGRFKGEILVNELKKRNPKYVLELGSYLGYSSILMAKELLENSKLISIEINPIHAAIANQIIKNSGLDNIAVSIIGKLNELICQLRKEVNVFDFVFIDHDKSMYLKDLILLEKSGLIDKNTIIVADNVIYPGSPDYLEYVKKNYNTSIKSGLIEGINKMDAIAISIKY